MNATLVSADRNSHVKIVATALSAALIVALLALGLH
jgi:hypothetical protein